MIDEVRKLERIIFNNPIVDVGAFPPLPNEELNNQRIESLVFNYTYHSLCYTYIRYTEKSWFVDIYYYFEQYKTNQIGKRRFIIAPGYQMSEKDEASFLHMIKMDEMIMFSSRVCSDYIKGISTVAPELNMRSYNSIAVALFHTYFACMRGSIREQLVKAGMINMAMLLWYIEDWNIIAKNIEEAFEIPYKMLKKIDSRNCIEKIIYKKHLREQIALAYKKYHHMINDIETFNEFQLQYLIDCTEEGKLDKRFLLELETLESGWDYEGDEYVDGFDVYRKVKEYQTLRNSLKKSSGDFLFPQYPSLRIEDLGRLYEFHSLLKTYIKYSSDYIDRMKSYLKKCEKYKYRNGNFEIFAPRTVQDIIEESEQQRNCLYQYVEKILKGEVIILFMREVTKINKSLVTIKINDNCIRETKRFANKPPTEEQMSFIYNYAKEKNLFIDEEAMY